MEINGKQGCKSNVNGTNDPKLEKKKEIGINL